MFYKIQVQYLWDIATLKTSKIMFEIKLWEIHLMSDYMHVEESIHLITKRSLKAR